MNNLQTIGRRLLLPLSAVLLLGLIAVPASAADSDSVDVTVNVDSLAVCFLKDGTITGTPTWPQLLAMDDLTLISFSVGSDELNDGSVYMRNGEEYKGWVIWRANCMWSMKVKRDSWDLDSYGVDLGLWDGDYYRPVTGTEWTYTQDGAAYGYNDLDWKLDLGDDPWSIPPDTYSTDVYFTMYIS